MSISMPVASKKTAIAVCIALGTIGTVSTAHAASTDMSVSSQQPTVVEQISPFSEGKKPAFSDEQKSTYIVRLSAPSVAAYNGGIRNLAATSLKTTGKSKLDTRAPEVQNYRSFLKSQQKSVMDLSRQTLGRNIAVKHQYSHVFNGMAMELTASEARSVAELPNVISIERERFETPNTDVGPKWIGAKKFWKLDERDYQGNAGENVVVAVLDTGINHDHPAFADIGGDGYDHTNPLGSGNYIPGSYCDVVDPTFCNDKLIGAWDMVNSAQDPNAPEDSDGHGSHTASTAAGNVIKAATLTAPTTDLTREISGVAPHANIIAYDVCIETCPGSALLAAVEQVVIDAAALPDGIHALNYSISGGDDPYNDAVELAFLNATAAGVYVAASAGNDGPGPSTNGHSSPWVSTTAALTHNRTLLNNITDLSSDGAPLSNIQGKGFTSGYGPAAIVYAGDYPTADGTDNETNPAQCLEPFPAGHFNGEIVICDRGTIARVAKGANVLAGGAGGLILANAEANGEAVSGDAHFLPAVHVGYNDGVTLKDWVANNANTTATIGGAELVLDKALGDITADFSSRGPASKIDIIKPDIGAPGVDIFAAIHTTDSSTGDEYGFISGTSMSSPHNAGAGALVAGSTDWTPYQIQSALMMTAKTRKIYKEDGVTDADPFDVGAGRINLKKVLQAGLVLDETPENFLAANPANGGDPKTLNIASMKDSSCVQGCSWTRTVTNVSGKTASWKLSAKSSTDGVDVSVEPSSLRLADGESADVTVTVDSTFAAADWSFGQLKLTPRGNELSVLRMPIAAFAAKSTSNVLSHTATSPATKGDTVNYSIDITNGTLEDEITVAATLPEGLEFVEGSATQTVALGTTTADVAFDGDKVTWSGTLTPSSLELQASATSPAGYLPMAALGIAPATCPSNCDDGAIIVDVAPFTFNGVAYSQVIMSMNGTIELGSDSGLAISATNAELPNTDAPNNVLAPLWTDLNPAAGGNFYTATVGNSVNSWNVFEWENVPRFGTDPADSANTHSFQIWIQADNTGNIWFTYGAQGDLTGVPATVGIENATGTIGTTTYFNGVGTAPAAGSELQVATVQGGAATISYEATVSKCKKRDGIVSNVTLTSGTVTENAFAATVCSKN